jgi:hypothetical protein
MSINLDGGVINTFFGLLFAVNIVAVFWGVVHYFSEFGSEHGKAEGKDLILNSISILIVLMVVFAIVNWIRSAVGF